MKTILVTGAAGFVGAHYSRRLLDDGYRVVGLDNLNDYYDVRLKRDRLSRLIGEHPAFEFHHADLADAEAMARLFAAHRYDCVVHLGAQAGVRYSLENPDAYIQSNLVGFTHVLEGCRRHEVPHLVFASSSSVYGANREIPFSERHAVDHPVSLYAATKRGGELLAHTYASLYGLPVTGLRFFTVYGPWGRPDMAYFSFTRDILAGRPIKVFNEGDLARDFTYIDDIVEGMVRLIPHVPAPATDWAERPDASYAPFRLYNIGNHSPVRLLDFIATLERLLGVTARKEFLPMQPGDVHTTYADVDALGQAVGFSPDTPLETGLARFVDWYRDYYGTRESARAGTLNY
ncbi:NAD-dependent epimerase/dehydratase [Salinisphaera sp. PC39]|uniref:NAD-dependent epimerase n=1 Tax=Salinisphaera sp. PC39 TaxID=1304156 RepID=UPI0033404B4A